MLAVEKAKTIVLRCCSHSFPGRVADTSAVISCGSCFTEDSVGSVSIPRPKCRESPDLTRDSAAAAVSISDATRHRRRRRVGTPRVDVVLRTHVRSTSSGV
jgi:hypothetical protein